MCNCLTTGPKVVNVTTTKPEPYTGKSIILKIIASGKAAQVTDGLKFGAAALGAVILVITVSYGFYRLINIPQQVGWVEKAY